MTEKRKTKEQLIKENEVLLKRNAELEDIVKRTSLDYSDHESLRGYKNRLLRNMRTDDQRSRTLPDMGYHGKSLKVGWSECRKGKKAS